MKFNAKNIFIIDGAGALLSALFTGIILPFYSELLGIPVSILHFLSLLPFIYAIYSMTCYWFVTLIKRWMLSTIIAGNILYCLISAAVIFFLENITLWGQALLAAEILVICIVVAIEFSVYRNFRKIYPIK